MTKPSTSIAALLLLLLPWACQAATLEALIAAALEAHPAIRAQQAQQDAAQAGVQSARWQYYPTASLTIEKATATGSDPAYLGDSNVSTLRLQQPLWSGGRLSAGLERAQAGLLVSGAAFEETRQQLALRVVQAYSDWLAAHLKIQANEKSMATHVSLHAQVQRRIEAGTSAQSDLMLAVARLKSLGADLAAVRAQRDIAVGHLEQLLGRRVKAQELNAAMSPPRALPAALPALLDRALEQHPAIQRAKALASVQEATVGERRAELKPEVYLRAERQYGNYTYSGAAPESRIFIGLSSRLGAGLSSLSNVDAAKALHQAALADILAQSRAVSEQVLSDYSLMLVSQDRLDAIKASLGAATEVSESYDRQFRAGRKSWLDVMNAAREMAQTEVQLADIESTYMLVSWRLSLYIQGLAAMLAGRS
ncbi:MAG: TolC family protein [Rhodoferax sp.]|nr:TolC family protein [Rhodoferax sp.]